MKKREKVVINIDIYCDILFSAISTPISSDLSEQGQIYSIKTLFICNIWSLDEKTWIIQQNSSYLLPKIEISLCLFVLIYSQDSQNYPAVLKAWFDDIDC